MKIKALIVAALVLTANAPAAVAPFFKVGVGDQVKVNFSPYNLLSTYMAPGQDNVMGNFQTHWFHAGWKTHFPVAIAGGACATGLEWSSLADYQSVLNAGKILVFVWWWHNDMPCDASIRADAEATATGCLKPLLQSLTNGEVWVVFEPEYNVSTGSAAGTGGACGGMRIHRDPTWGTHINNMILQAKAGAHAGLTVKAGPAIGGFGYDENVYTLEPSLENCYANSDFIAYHHITRNDTYTSDPWAAPDPEAVKFSLSLSRYLSRRFNKPLFYAYWSSRNGLAGQGQQDADLKSHFANRAEFEADGVQGFGPYWYFDNGYPGEGLKSAPLSPYSVFNTWKAEANAIMTGTNGTHSIGFVSPDHGDIFDAPGPLNVQWISRGRPATNSTYSTAYRINGGADQAFPNGYSSGGFPDSTGFSAPLSLCTIAPSCNVQVKAAADDATFAYSRRFTVRNPNYTSNANDKFDITLNGWSGANAWFSGGGKFTAALSSAQWFHGGSSMELSGAFTAATQKWAVGTNTSVVIPSGSPATLNFKMYIPFDLNPTVDMGSAVTFLNYQIRMNSVLYDNYSGPLIPLEMGWNDVTITITGGTAGGTVDHVDLVVFNKWGQAGDAFFSVGANPKIYVDELHYGGPCAFTPLGGGCASPTNTPLVTATFTPTRTDSPQPGSPTPSPTNSPIATFTPTPAAACAADWNFDDGTLQNWVVDSGPAAGLASLTTLPHDGSNSMRASLALAQSAGSTQVLLKNTTGFPRDYTGQTLHYWLYIPAGFSDVSNPSGATLYVKTTAAFTWNESTWMNLPSTAGWVEITFNVSAIANISDVREVGLKIALGGTSPSPPASTVYIDSVGRMSGACASPTPTPTPTRTPAAPTFTFTPTPTASPTRTLSPTPSMTSTRSASPTPSITLTYSLTPTTSSSMTSTPVVNTATFTPTPTPSPTQTMSFSATASPTFSDTRTATVSFTPSDSPSPTRTLSFTQSATPTLTGTPLPGSPTNTMSFTPTYSITLTATPTPSPSSSATPTLTATETASFTDSPTPTQSPTVSPTFSDSPTPLPGSPTNTPTFTATPSHSPTLSWTPSFTRTSTPTPSASPSTTQSFTPSQTPLGSFTATPTRTASPTPTKTPLVSPNPTPDYGQVLETLPVFNPQDGAGTVFIAARLNGRADGFELRIYSKAYNLIGKGELSGSFLNGWHSLAFVMPELANGLWFYQIRAVNAGKKSGLPRTGKILILK